MNTRIKFTLIHIEADRINQVTNANTENTKQSAVSNMFRKYKNTFEVLGCLKGEYQIEIDPSIRPVQHHPRHVPLSLKQELKKKLGELEKQGITAKVTGSTPWISIRCILLKTYYQTFPRKKCFECLTQKMDFIR